MKILGINSIFILLAAAAGCGITLGLVALALKDKLNSFDYHIDLQQDSIRVVDEYHDTTIHFDDLEEYLIRDNL